MTDRKLVLCVVDSLRTDMLVEAARGGAAPTFATLLERGSLIGDCVSSFPSVTPVCNSEIVTGERPDRHWISGSNWYHRAEGRYVEYGSSFEATRAFGLFRTLYDIVYNMNMSHLSHEVETFFERLGDHGVRSACTPFLIYRGRTRHELGLEGLLRRVAVAASFRHATWGPDELFYGELYSSRAVDCKPTLARPGTRDEYSACVGRELAENDLYDFLLFSLPDNDHHSHKFGPEAQLESIARADAAFTELADAAGGLDDVPRRERGDPARRPRADQGRARAAAGRGAGHRTGGCSSRTAIPPHAELAVSPIARAAAVYVLTEGRRAERALAGVRDRLREIEGVDLFAWLERRGGGDRARRGRSFAFAPVREVVDRRGRGWDIEGDLGALVAEIDDGRFDSPAYPDALSRLWSALRAPHAGEILISAAPGYELVDWGGMTHCPGGSHGSLGAGDSLGPLLLCGLEPPAAPVREQWALLRHRRPRARPLRDRPGR